MSVRRDGIAQLVRYLERVGRDEGWLVIFDRRKDRTWDELIWAEDVEIEGQRLHPRGG